MARRPYTPRGMPTRYLEGAPEEVREGVLDIFHISPPAPLDYDIILRDPDLLRVSGEVVGLDFGRSGERGCHFFLAAPWQARAYRGRNRRRRVAWLDLPEDTREAVLAYLRETP